MKHFYSNQINSIHQDELGLRNVRKEKGTPFVSFLTILLLIVFTTFEVNATNFIKDSKYQSQQTECNFELIVKGQNQQDMNDQSPVYYLIELQNNSSESITFSISVQNFSDFPENPGGSSTDSNILLNNSLEDADHNSIPNQVTVESEATLQFMVKLTASPDMEPGKWNGTKVNVSSNSCIGISKSALLHTFTSVPEGWGYVVPFKNSEKSKYSKQYFALASSLYIKADL